MYLTHDDLSKYWLIDIETDDLVASKIWCAVLKNLETKAVYRIVGPSALKQFLERIPDDHYFVGHNIVSFDIPVVNRLLGLSIPIDRLVDTLVLSYLYHPTMPEGHGLEAWGRRLRKPKGDFHDFSHFSQEMLDYCAQDIEVTHELFLRLTERMRKRDFSEKSCWLEHRTADIIRRQKVNGFKFDVPAANVLYADLRGKQRALELSIKELFPPLRKEVARYKYRVKQDGLPVSSFLRHQLEYPEIRSEAGGTEYSCWDDIEFNLGSPQQRVDRLTSLGYEPTEFTPKGAPKVDEDSLLDFAESSGLPEVKELAEWLVINGRANMINTWLNNVGPDDRMHGSVFSCGAGSRRMTHSGPNTANIPSNEVPYGRDVRSLWTASEGRVLVGTDAKAAQMRMFGHYLNNPEVAKLYIEGDPHTVNAEAIGVSRKIAKNVFYAFIFGAQNKKLGSTAGGQNAKFGAHCRTTLFRVTPGLERLIKSIEEEYLHNDGFLRCIDGGFVRCPSPHAALNYKVQSAEACLMKQGSIFLDERVKQRGFDAFKVGDIHDEWQWDVLPADAEEFGTCSVQCIRDAGEELRFTVPMDGDYKVGRTWADTH